MSVFVVVGATGGIGSAVARRLRARGFAVRLIGRDEQRLATLAAATGAGYAVADATRVTELEGAIGEGVQGIVNCVGSLLLKPCHLTSEAEWEQVISTNLTSAYATVRAGAKAMMATGGSIVLCSTAAARMGMANHEAIAAAKGGVMGLALSAAATYAPRRIRVNCVAPGLVDTPLAARITGNPAALQASTAMHPLGRIGTADDVASGIVWLLDPENSWVTGQVLGIDGGLGTLRSR